MLLLTVDSVVELQRELGMRKLKTVKGKAPGPTGLKGQDRQWFDDALIKVGLKQNEVGRMLKQRKIMDATALSRTVNGERELKPHEATVLAEILNVDALELLRRFGHDLRTRVPAILLAATINAAGVLEPIADPQPLPPSVIERIKDAALSIEGGLVAAQIRAPDGPLRYWDDAIVLYRPSDRIEPDVASKPAICRDSKGKQFFAYVTAIRKTGEARAILTTADGPVEFQARSATPILVMIT